MGADVISDSNVVGEAHRQWRLAMRRMVIVGLIGYAFGYFAFGRLVGFSAETLAMFLISSVAAWIAIPWVSFDVYASSLEGRSDDLVARIRGISFPGSLLAVLCVFSATWLGRGYWSLVFWMLAGATMSYCFSRMLLSAYDRGRMAAGQRQ